MRASTFHILAGAIGACLALSGATAAEKILVGPSTGKATIVSLTGVDTATAAVAFKQEREDIAAACFERDEIHARYAADPAAAREKLKADCAAKSAPADAPPVTRKADCPRLTVQMEPDYRYLGGVFTLAKAAKENDGVRTTWKSTRARKTVDNCLTCGTPEINDTFRVLCPQAYKSKFGGLEPF